MLGYQSRARQIRRMQQRAARRRQRRAERERRLLGSGRLWYPDVEHPQRVA